MKSSSVYVDIIVTLWNISIFRCEPWLFIRMNWDSPWYPVVLVADGTIMYDVYSTLTKWAMGCEIPEFVSAACSPMFTSKLLKGVGCDKPVSMTIAVVFFGEAVSIGTLVDKLIRSTQVWLMYISSYATDQPGHSVGHPAGALAYFVIGFLYMVGLRLVWRSVKMTMSFLESSWLFQGVIPYTHTNCVWYQLM